MADAPEDRFHVRLAGTPQPDGRDIVVTATGNLDWFEAGRLADAIQEARRQQQLRHLKTPKRKARS